LETLEKAEMDLIKRL